MSQPKIEAKECCQKTKSDSLVIQRALDRHGLSGVSIDPEGNIPNWNDDSELRSPRVRVRERIPPMRVFPLFALLLISGCANPRFRFEQIDRDPPVVLPLSFDGFYGLRDGATVNAEARFSGGNDSVTMNVVLFLRPPAEFQSGRYQGIIDGKMISGSVECLSLSFQGGQTALPAVGGIFVLKRENSPSYRVTIPAAQLARRPSH
jgi:hypothetical protein